MCNIVDISMCSRYFFWRSTSLFYQLCLFWSLISVSSVDVHYTLIYSKNILHFGKFSKLSILVNDLFPGPTISVTIGDRVSITVINNFPNRHDGDGLSIHWHGIRQLGTPWSDGATGITNCPISVGQNYTYSFICDQAGTFWYHPHILSLRADGGYGMFIVQDPKDPHLGKYDEERHIILSDWYQQSAGESHCVCNTTGNSLLQDILEILS
jgi:FtsP/CotA-like multicopper oxidase with cupredoxin domain